jgi:hypothetical protein
MLYADASGGHFTMLHGESLIAIQPSTASTQPPTSIYSQQQLQRILHHLLKLANPFTTNSTINNLMIKASSNRYLVIPLYRGAFFALDGDSDLLGGADSEDAGLWWVDDGGKSVDCGVHAHVADGEGSALVFFRLELAVSGALSEVFNLGGDGFETETFN